MLNLRPDGPAVGPDEPVALDLDIHRLYHIGVDRLDRLRHQVHFAHSNLLGVCLTNSVRERDTVLSGFLRQPFKFLGDLLHQLGIH